jgi:hypothetical protein
LPGLDSKTKASIIHCVLSGGSLQDECEIFSFEDDDGRKHYQAVAPSKSDAKSACVFSLPTDGPNVYVTMSDGDRAVVRRVLAALEETETQSSVKLGNVLLLNSPELRAVNIVGVILLPPNVSNALNHLPPTITIRDVTYHFLLVVFLTEREHNVWKGEGHDALMDLFSTSDKDLVAFGDSREK